MGKAKKLKELRKEERANQPAPLIKRVKPTRENLKRINWAALASVAVVIGLSVGLVSAYRYALLHPEKFGKKNQTSSNDNNKGGTTKVSDKTYSAAPPMTIDVAKKYTAVMQTNMGVIKIALDAKKAPKTVNNFVFLARDKFYDGLVFHRIIPGFVIQGGDPKGDGTGGPGYKFEDELPSAGEYKLGSLAMANSGPNTNGSQFFIITGSQGVSLPPSYSLFGVVTEGLEVAQKIEKVDRDERDMPKSKVLIEHVGIEEAL